MFVAEWWEVCFLAWKLMVRLPLLQIIIYWLINYLKNSYKFIKKWIIYQIWYIDWKNIIIMKLIFYHTTAMKWLKTEMHINLLINIKEVISIFIVFHHICMVFGISRNNNQYHRIKLHFKVYYWYSITIFLYLNNNYFKLCSWYSRGIPCPCHIIFTSA